MNILITPHALMSPVNQKGLDIDDFLMHYRTLNFISKSQKIFTPYVYNDTTDILSSSNLFPSYNIFDKHIKENELDDYISANDLVSLFNTIIEKCTVINDITDVFTIEIDQSHSLQEISTTPICNYKTNNILALCDYLNSQNQLTILPVVDNNLSTQIFDQIIMSMLVYTQEEILTITNYKPELQLFSCCNEILALCTPDEVWDKSTTDECLRLAIYLKCNELIKSNSVSYTDKFDIDSVVIGEHFFESLKKNQCVNGGSFSKNTLDCIARLLLKSPKSELKKFFRSDDKSKPRTRGKDIAYRIHLTESGLALRLMVWMLPCGNYELANVGPKHELVIK
ncbi:hypothetical protein ACET8S_17190 [Aeromonas veronii]